MALALTEEHVALAESVRGWAGHTAPPPVIRSGLAAGDHGAALYRDTLRPGLAAQGLLGLHLPEALGGQGAGLPELAVEAGELARALVPGGFLPTVLAGAVLASAIDAAAGGADTSELESLVKELAAGALTAAVGLAPAPGVAVVELEPLDPLMQRRRHPAPGRARDIVEPRPGFERPGHGGE